MSSDILRSGEHSISVRLAKAMIAASQRTPFGGVGGYSSEAFAAKGDARPFPQAEREKQYYREFFDLFPSGVLDAAIRDATVLDFGFGYGGKTVEYRRTSGAKFVYGVEPFENHVRLARQYAESVGETLVDFRLCSQNEIPLPDNSIDTVVSHDVLEHVLDPMVSIKEVRRVLKPGGQAFLVFPVYYGAASHHLDYLTRLPGLHWLFSAETLVEAVNELLAEQQNAGTPQQPAPQLSFDGRHRVLPMLNGLSGRHLKQLTGGFEIVHERRMALMGRRRGIGVVTRTLTSSALPTGWRDLLTSAMVYVLRKPV